MTWALASWAIEVDTEVDTDVTCELDVGSEAEFVAALDCAESGDTITLQTPFAISGGQREVQVDNLTIQGASSATPYPIPALQVSGRTLTLENVDLAEADTPTSTTSSLAASAALTLQGATLVANNIALGVPDSYAIYATDDSVISLDNPTALAQGSDAGIYPAIWMADTALTITGDASGGCRFENYLDSGVIKALGQSTLDIRDCRFEDNAAYGLGVYESGPYSDGFGVGGSIEVIGENGATLTLDGVDFVNQVADDVGGAVFVQDTDLVLTDTTFTNSEAGKFAGAIGQQISSLSGLTGSFTDVEIDEAYGGQAGAGLFLYGVEATVDGLAITDTVVDEVGAALYVREGSFTATNLVVDGAEAPNGGGGLVVYGNTALDIDGDFSNCDATLGGAFYLESNTGDRITGTITGTYTDNTAQYGGLAYVAQGADLTFLDLEVDMAGVTDAPSQGGAYFLWNQYGTVTIDGGTYEGLIADQRAAFLFVYSDVDVVVTDVEAGPSTENDPRNGGAIATDPGASLEISDSTFRGFQTRGNGGAIYALGTELELDDVQLLDNSAEYGGAIYLEDGEASIDRVQFTDNDADEHGGALYTTSTELTLRRSRFCANGAKQDGQALWILLESDDTATLNNNSLQDHTSRGESVARFEGEGTASVVNNSWAWATGAMVSADADGTLDLRNNVFWGGELGVSSGEDLELDYNLYYELDEDSDVGTGANAVFEDPWLTSYLAEACEDSQLWLAANSPAIDAGDPAVLDSDASRSDIGAFSGPWVQDLTYGPEGSEPQDTAEPVVDGVMLRSGSCGQGSAAWLWLPVPLVLLMRRRRD